MTPERLFVGLRQLALMCIVLISGGCTRHASPVSISPLPERGTTSVRFITRPRSIPKGQDFDPPRPKVPLKPPEYPAGALTAKVGAATVALRFVISEKGEVTEVGDCPGTASTGGGVFAAEFRSAAVAAVRSWKFTPAKIQWVKDGTDLNGDGKPDFVRVIRSMPVSVYLDVAFDFDLVRGKPRVQPVAPQNNPVGRHRTGSSKAPGSGFAP